MGFLRLDNYENLCKGYEYLLLEINVIYYKRKVIKFKLFLMNAVGIVRGPNTEIDYKDTNVGTCVDTVIQDVRIYLSRFYIILTTQ